MQIIATDSAMALATSVAAELGGSAPTRLQTSRFANGQIEIAVQIEDREIVFFQAIPDRVHYRTFELLLGIDTLHSLGATAVTVVLPHLPYSRSDKPPVGGGAVAASLIARLMVEAGLTRLITTELHVPQIASFFPCPVSNVSFIPALAQHLQRNHPRDWTIVSPDLGGAKRAEELAVLLDCPIAILRKQRDAQSRWCFEIIGNVAGRETLLVDDEINSGQTLFSAAALLRRGGAASVSIAVAHANLTAQAAAQVGTQTLDHFIVSDSSGTHNLPANAEIVSLAPAIADALRNHSPNGG